MSKVFAYSLYFSTKRCDKDCGRKTGAGNQGGFVWDPAGNALHKRRPQLAERQKPKLCWDEHEAAVRQIPFTGGRYGGVWCGVRWISSVVKTVSLHYRHVHETMISGRRSSPFATSGGSPIGSSGKIDSGVGPRRKSRVKRLRLEYAWWASDAACCTVAGCW